MTSPKTDGPENQGEPELRRSDWILLPMLGILTIVILAVSVELFARWIFPQLGTGPAGEDCMIFSDPVTGSRGIPNCRVMEKIAEGPEFQYRFNNLGFRSDTDFGPKAPGTYRIVMLGTSTTMGMRVPINQTFAVLLPMELSRRTGRKIELYNEAMPYRAPDVIADHFSEVLNAKPDMVLWALNIGDVGNQGKNKMLPIHDRKDSFSVRAWHRIQEARAAGSFMDLIRYIFRHTRTAVLLTHYLYNSRSQYIKASILTDKYMTEPTQDQRIKLQQFDQDFARIESQASKEGVLLVVVLLPDHAQTDMILSQDLPPGVDPYESDREIRSIVTKHGGTYIDIFPDVRRHPELQYGYYNADGHPNALGHAIFTEVLAKELTNGSVPALKAAAQPQLLLTQGR